MKNRSTLAASLGLVSLCFLILGCSKASTGFLPSSSKNVGLRPLKTQELTQDLAQEVQLFKSYYGPYSYKQSRFSFNIDELATQLSGKIAQAQSEDEALGYLYQFGASLHDGHVQIRHTLSSSEVSSYSLPFGLSPVEGKALVANIVKEKLKDTPIALGDELVTLDGKTPGEYLASIVKYKSWATEESNKHLIAFITNRASYFTEIKPTKEVATAVFKNAKGETYQVNIPWSVGKYNPKDTGFYQPGNQLATAWVDDFNEALQGSLYQMGNPVPFFASEGVKKKFSWVQVYASDEARTAAGLGKDEKPPVFAALYRVQNKTILLVRSFSYSPTDYSVEVYLKYYLAVLKEYEPLADVLVLDQTHNPGGNGYYCTSLASMFLTSSNNAPVQMCHADRKWINDMNQGAATDTKNENPNGLRLSIAMAHTIEKAYDEGKELSEPLPIFSGDLKLSSYGDYRWKKPRLVLIDELAGSCGDVFPMILRDNKATKFFGQTTMGLGGNVEEVGVLTNSQVSVKVTRGLFMTYKESNQYEPSDYIENNGVQPDYLYTHTAEDFRAGFVNYVRSFSEKAIEQIGAAQ